MDGKEDRPDDRPDDHPQGDQLSDDDVVPKPLKINKKRHSTNLDTIVRSSSLAVRSSPTVQDLGSRPVNHRMGGSLSIPSSTMRNLENRPVNHRTHGSLSILPSSTIQSLQNGAVVPTRNGSLPRSQSQHGILKKSPTDKVSGKNTLGQGYTATCNSTSSASINPGKDLVSDLMPRQRAQNDDQISSSPSKKGTKVSFDLGQLPQRAVTTGSRLAHLLSPLVDSPTIPTAQAPILVKSDTRAATIGDIPEAETLIQSSEKGLKRHSSIKERLMSRVRNGLNSKPRVSGGVAQKSDGNAAHFREDETRHHGDTITEYHHSENTRHSSGGVSNTSAVNTISSVNSPSLVGSDLDNLLNAFPSPPTTTRKIRRHTSTALSFLQPANIKPIIIVPPPKLSPMNTRPKAIGSAQKLSPMATRRGIGPGAYEYFAGNGAELDAVSEIDNLDSGNGKDFFVAVEMTGTFCRSEHGGARTPYNALEVAVIIDNS